MCSICSPHQQWISVLTPSTSCLPRINQQNSPISHSVMTTIFCTCSNKGNDIFPRESSSHYSKARDSLFVWVDEGRQAWAGTGLCSPLPQNGPHRLATESIRPCRHPFSRKKTGNTSFFWAGVRFQSPDCHVYPYLCVGVHICKDGICLWSKRCLSTEVSIHCPSKDTFQQLPLVLFPFSCSFQASETDNQTTESVSAKCLLMQKT